MPRHKQIFPYKTTIGCFPILKILELHMRLTHHQPMRNRAACKYDEQQHAQCGKQQITQHAEVQVNPFIRLNRDRQKCHKHHANTRRQNTFGCVAAREREAVVDRHRQTIDDAN